MESKKKPKVNSFGARELEKAAEKFDKFDEDVKALTLDRMKEAPKEEKEEQTKLSQKDWEKAGEIYLKPHKSIAPGPKPKTGEFTDKFNEKFRESYNYDKEYVRFVAENNEIIGETIDIWTRPYPGVPAEEWLVPTNKPVWGPRYLAEQIKRKNYHRLTMNNHVVKEETQMGTITGGIVADSIVQRLDAKSAPKTTISFHKKVSSF
jgi:hypothetical protein